MIRAGIPHLSHMHILHSAGISLTSLLRLGFENDPDEAL